MVSIRDESGSDAAFTVCRPTCGYWSDCEYSSKSRTGENIEANKRRCPWEGSTVRGPVAIGDPIRVSSWTNLERTVCDLHRREAGILIDLL